MTQPAVHRTFTFTCQACGKTVQVTDGDAEAHRCPSAPSFAFTIAARGLADHPWQEYNAHGYLCHYPGCQLTPDEHEETP